jgi:Kef-type K+ transport system membrane component KefB
MSELGVVILLFTVGLEVRVDDLLAVGRPAVMVGVLGMVLPVAAGVGLMLVTGAEVAPALFVGLGLAATSIGITARVLGEMNVLDRAFSRVILGAAIVDDILVLLAIGIVSGAAVGEVSASTLLVVVAAVGMLVLGFAVARRARGLRREVFTWPLFADTPLVPAFILMLAVALLAAGIGLAAIIGAFVAGLIVAETEAHDELERDMGPLSQIFTPFFFAVTGAQLDLGALLRPEVAVLAISLAVAGVFTKLIGGTLGALSIGRWEAVSVGAGMVPRGEVGVVVATLGLSAGVLSTDLFSALLVAVVLTTVVGPYLLTAAVRRVPQKSLS